MPDDLLLIPVLQFTAIEIVDKALLQMKSMGIKAKSKAVDKMDASEMPDWIDTGNPGEGWFLFIEKAEFERGMTALGELMGYTPDDR